MIPDAAAAYPPERHLLRDLRIAIVREADARRAELPIVPEILSATGGVRAGVLATLADVAAGEAAIAAVHPDWVATSSLVLHVSAPAREGLLGATPRVLRSGRGNAVVEVALADARGPVGRATLGFSVLAARGDVQRMGVGAEEPRTVFAREGSVFSAPLAEALGAVVVDAGAGAIELPLRPYLVNSLGGLQGGAGALLAELAAETAAGAPVRDLAIHYLAQGRVGPVASRAEILSRESASTWLRVTLVDLGAERRPMLVASARAA